MPPAPAIQTRQRRGCCHAGPHLSCDRDAGGDILYVTVPITWLSPSTRSERHQYQSLVRLVVVVLPGLQGLYPPEPATRVPVLDVADALLVDATACHPAHAVDEVHALLVVDPLADDL